jgi:dihydrolipoamide dehydrogenase
MKQADIAIIGAGPGGYVAALRASQLGAKVIVIEKEAVGGVCLNWGCIPTKALLRSAEVYALVKEAAKFGISAGEPQADWGKIQARKAQVVKQLVNGVKMLLNRAGVETVMGEAAFARPDTLVVRQAEGTETVTATNIIIATGSRTLQVPIPGLDGPDVIDSTGALSLEQLPKSLCVIGGGAIGIEFASLFNTLGVQVTVIEMLPRLAPLMDASIGEGLAWSMGRQGVKIMLQTRVTRVDHVEGGCRVAVQGPEGEAVIEAEKVLSAIGRAPNVENLGLEKIGLTPTRKGIPVDNRMRTVVPNVYAIGDVAVEGPMQPRTRALWRWRMPWAIPPRWTIPPCRAASLACPRRRAWASPRNRPARRVTRCRWAPLRWPTTARPWPWARPMALSRSSQRPSTAPCWACTSSAHMPAT